FSLASCNVADKDDYARVAEDICGCVNSKSEDISQGMKTAVIDAVENNQEIEASIDAFAEENPDQALKDGLAMMELGERIEGCIADLETKYKDLYSNESDEEIERRLLEALRKNKECKWTHALIKSEMQAE
ncbi:MAG: hypothetical protein ACKO7B_04725, partial [Flavobacteriales bacterium]